MICGPASSKQVGVALLIRIRHGKVCAVEKGPDAKQIIALLIIYALINAASFVGARPSRDEFLRFVDSN